jgi:histone-lysine N-methyltransferase SETMAR
LRPAIHTKWWGRLSEGDLILHDYAWPHTAACTGEALRVLKCEVFNHPAYSQDLAPSDIHLFGPLNAALRGHRFADEKLKEVVHDWLCTQPKKFFLMASECLWTPGQSGLRSRQTM